MCLREGNASLVIDKTQKHVDDMEINVLVGST